MDDIDRRIVDCLAAVFPDLEPRELTVLDQKQNAIWDSVAHATIIAALGEEFERDFDFEAFADATTYERLVAAVKEQLASGRD
ncbi:MAG TPA: acyl carrier protein [Polyangiales bacterium]|jgi:acyl carrier protein|nr:acyl carrier protein [Polyangiales bacterium]